MISLRNEDWCAAYGCEELVPQGTLMCQKHWRMVSPETRLDLGCIVLCHSSREEVGDSPWRTCLPQGRAFGMSYRIKAALAVHEVAEKEGRSLERLHVHL